MEMGKFFKNTVLHNSCFKIRIIGPEEFAIINLPRFLKYLEKLKMWIY